MRRMWTCLGLALVMIFGLNAWADRKVQILTTTTDLGYLARQLGGERVAVRTMMKGWQDPHFMDARPDFVVWASQADLFLEIGLELEAAWTDTLLKNSRNTQIQRGAIGYCEVA